MKVLSTELRQLFNSSVSDVSFFFEFKLKNQTYKRLTSWTKDVIYNDEHYFSANGLIPTAFESRTDATTQDMQLELLIDGNIMKLSEIKNGFYDECEVKIFLASPSMMNERLYMSKGTLGSYKIKDDTSVSFEYKGIFYRLEKSIGDVYKHSCRANLYDSRCKVNKESYKLQDSVGEIITTKKFTAASIISFPDGYYNFGRLVFETGLNAGVEFSIKSQVGNQIDLLLEPANPVSVSDQFTIYAGCDKSFNSCKTKFNNYLNFRGEPFIPGKEALAVYSN